MFNKHKTLVENLESSSKSLKHIEDSYMHQLAVMVDLGMIRILPGFKVEFAYIGFQNTTVPRGTFKFIKEIIFRGDINETTFIIGVNKGGLFNDHQFDLGVEVKQIKDIISEIIFYPSGQMATTTSTSAYNYIDLEKLKSACLMIPGFDRTLLCPDGSVPPNIVDTSIDMVSPFSVSVSDSIDTSVGVGESIGVTADTFVSVCDLSDDKAMNEFVSEPEDLGDGDRSDFDRVISYFMECGFIDQLKFDGGYVSLKSHLIWGTTIYSECGISRIDSNSIVFKFINIKTGNLDSVRIGLEEIRVAIDSGEIIVKKFPKSDLRKIYPITVL